jgi:hypothetical protein
MHRSLVDLSSPAMVDTTFGKENMTKPCAKMKEDTCGYNARFCRVDERTEEVMNGLEVHDALQEKLRGQKKTMSKADRPRAMSLWEMEGFIASWETIELSTKANMPEDDFVEGELSVLTRGDWIGSRLGLELGLVSE